MVSHNYPSCWCRCLVWCCWDEHAWVLATVQRRFRDAWGWLQSYIVLVQQEVQEDFETKITDTAQVRMHYFPGNRVQINQVQSVEVSAIGLSSPDSPGNCPH